MNKPRLIDANKLLEDMKRKCGGICKECGYSTFLASDEHCGLIEEQPTAYDTDKVVKELIDHAQECTDRITYEIHSFVSLFDAIRIVKGNYSEKPNSSKGGANNGL